jgi:hypothetical protein
VRYELRLEMQLVILVVFMNLLDLGEFYMTLLYLKLRLKSGNTEGLFV